MLLNREKSGLVLVDVQEKLTPLVREASTVVKWCLWLLRLAQELTVPVIVSEQYPRGLGKTVEPLRTSFSSMTVIEKVSFSCYGDPSFIKAWQATGRQQVVLMGIETHVCILQTALDMLNAGTEVFVVVDAVSSRERFHHTKGLQRMQHAGVQLVTTEMVFFEWVKQAGTVAFKALSQTYLKQRI